MTNMTLIEYIKYRRLMLSYKYLLEHKPVDISGAIFISGFDNQQSYTDKVREVFGNPPKRAADVNNIELFVNALYWDDISCENAIEEPEMLGAENMEKETRFGIDLKTYEKMQKALALEELYGFEKHFSDFAFSFSENHDVSLDDSFSYVDSLRDFGVCHLSYDEDDENCVNSSPEEELIRFGEDEFYVTMFFTHGISISGAHELMEIYHVCEEDIVTEDTVFLRQLLKMDMEISFNYAKRAYNYFKNNASKQYNRADWEHYWRMVGLDTHFEIAFSELEGGHGCGMRWDNLNTDIDYWVDEY